MKKLLLILLCLPLIGFGQCISGDCKNGQGTFTWDITNNYGGWLNGNKYAGEWKDGERNGQGTFTWADGNKYVGEWKDGKRHGYGTYTLSSDNLDSGEWKEDVYEGEWKEDKRILTINHQNFVERYYNAHVQEDFDYFSSVFPENNIGWYNYNGGNLRSKKEVIEGRMRTFKKENWILTSISGLKVLKEDEASVLITYKLNYIRIIAGKSPCPHCDGNATEWMIINKNSKKITNIE